MMHAKKWYIITVVIMMLIAVVVSVSTPGCFKSSKDEETGSSVPAPGAFELGIPADVGLVDIADTEVPLSWTASVNAANYLLEVSTDDTFGPAYSVYSDTLAANITE